MKRTCTASSTPCPYFSDADGKLYCVKDGHKFCLTCIGHDPNSWCFWEKSEAEYEAWFKSPEYKAKLEREKAWLNRPKIKLVCVVCGATQILGREEFTDKRHRRKYEPESWCEKCRDLTEHEWR